LNKKINIAIDGHSSCGKSTLAKDIAKHYTYVYIDSGAMYRAVSLYILNNEIAASDKDAVISALKNIDIDIQYNNEEFRILLNGIDISSEIIKIEVSNIVSEVAAIPEVRRKLVREQQKLGENKGVVMDGRDIGTVVFPDAEVKLFITAEIEVRTERRFLELQEKGLNTPFEEVKSNLTHRDNIDSSREDSPLIQADDAILIDNSYMGREEQLFLACKIIDEKIK
jgi:cytidylate kinase